MDIGLFIATERVKNNLSKPKLAKMIGCTTRAIEYWESGKRNISLEYLDKILKAFNISIQIGYKGDLD
jgi:transcriptional regulator with XRE-family HTH domain